MGNPAALTSYKSHVAEIVDGLQAIKNGEKKLLVKATHDTILVTLFDMFGWNRDLGKVFDGRGVPKCANFLLVLVQCEECNEPRVLAVHNGKVKILFEECAVPGQQKLHDYDCFVGKISAFK